MNYITRIQETVILNYINLQEPHKDILLVEGARQVGKTTLIEHLLEGIKGPVIKINLEKQALLRKKIDACREFSEFDELLRDEYGFDPTRASVLFIDESQESTRLGGFVRFMKEDWINTSVILSGSTLTRLFRPGVRYPVGRITRLTITPFTFMEFLRAQGTQGFSDGFSTGFNTPEKARNSEELIGAVRAWERPVSPQRHRKLLEHYDVYLNVGGLPQVVLDAVRKPENAPKRQESIMADYEQDFIRLFGEESIAIVNACFRSVAHFVGSPSKNSTVMPSPTSAMHQQINQVFARLEEWKLILKSPQRGRSPEASYGYHPKRYLFDTGLLKHLRESALPALALLDKTPPAPRTALGGVIENQAAVEITRAGFELTGWKRSSSGGEIDFILRYQGRAIPLECKATREIKGTHLKGIDKYLEECDCPTGFIASGAPFQVIPHNGRRVVNLPVYALENIREAVERYG